MFTIPLMKSVGYMPYFAGAVEAVASTGGQIMAPVMGAAAFIMADSWEFPTFMWQSRLLYRHCCTILLSWYRYTLKQRGSVSWASQGKTPKAMPLLKKKGHLLIPLAAIIYFLLSGYTPLKAAYYGILATLIVSFLNKETRVTFPKLIEALDSGARGALGVACACGTVGIIVGTATLTGLGLRIASAIITSQEVSCSSRCS
jgi:TRAP-type uncharacterized transport system fused permease subunit